MNLFQILITSVVCASTVTALANIIVSLQNNRRLLAIENEKKTSTLTQYRYTHLYEVLQDWINESKKLEAPQNRDTMLSEKEIADHLNNSLRLLEQKYSVAKPLVEKGLWGNIEYLIKQAIEDRESTYVWLVSDKEPTYRIVDYPEALSCYRDSYYKVKEQFESVIQKQLQLLLSVD